MAMVSRIELSVITKLEIVFKPINCRPNMSYDDALDDSFVVEYASKVSIVDISLTDAANSVAISQHSGSSRLSCSFTEQIVEDLRWVNRCSYFINDEYG